MADNGSTPVLPGTDRHYVYGFESRPCLSSRKLEDTKGRNTDWSGAMNVPENKGLDRTAQAARLSVAPMMDNAEGS